MSRGDAGIVRPTLQVVVSSEQDVIKMAPVVKLLQEYYYQHINTEIVQVELQGQALAASLSLFQLAADRRVDFNEHHQESTGAIVARAIAAFSALLSQEDYPNTRVVVVVQGDSNIAVGAAMAAHYQKIPVIHVNAGSLTGDMLNPHPEEFHRRSISSIASLCIVSTSSERDALVRVGADPDSIAVTGSSAANAVQDLSLETLSTEDESIIQSINGIVGSHFKRTGSKQQVVVVPSPREEELVAMIDAVVALASHHPQYLYFFLLPTVLTDETIVSPLHSLENVHVLKSSSYAIIVLLLSAAAVVVSGTNDWVEEAILLNTHCVLVRYFVRFICSKYYLNSNVFCCYSNVSTWIDAEIAGVVQRVSPRSEDIVRITADRLISLSDTDKTKKLFKLYGDEHSKLRASCRIAALVLDVSMSALGNFQCGHTSDISREFVSSVSAREPLSRRVDPNNEEETEQAIEELTASFPLTRHPQGLFRPNYEPNHITVVLTQYKRNTTELQLRAIFAQTVFSSIDRIIIFQNEDFVDLSFLKDIDFSAEILEVATPQNKRGLQRNRKKQPNRMHDIIEIVHSPHYNYKYHGRFALALLFDTEYTSIFDDDTFPQPRWLEYATKTSGTMFVMFIVVRRFEFLFLSVLLQMK